MSAWTGKPCVDCKRRKGPKQKDNKRCWSCQRKVDKDAAANAHGKRIEAIYGISGDDYWALYEFQGGRCAICRWGQGKRKRLAVDHDHKCTVGHDPKTGCPECVRGLLCSFCNNVVGRFRDAIEVFQRAIDYLTNPPWKRMQDIRRQSG